MLGYIKKYFEGKKNITTKYEKKIIKKKLTDKNAIKFIIAPDLLPIILNTYKNVYYESDAEY